MPKLKRSYVPSILVNFLFLTLVLHANGQQYDPVQSSGVVEFGYFIPEQLDDVAMTRLQVETAIHYSVEVINLYLSHKGAGFTVAVSSKNQLEASMVNLNALSKEGVDLIIGPESSSSLYAIMDQARGNNQLLFSYGSSSPIPEFNTKENVFRIMPNGVNHASNIVRGLKDAGVTHVSVLYRDEALGQGLSSEIERQGKSANLKFMSTPYTPQADPDPEFYKMLLRGKFRKRLGLQVDSAGYDKTAVVVLGFEELGDLMAAAYSDNASDVLQQVQWYGLNDIPEILKNPYARVFANKVRYTVDCLMPGPDTTELEDVKQQLSKALPAGIEPVFYAFSVYETIQLLGRAVEMAGKSDTDSIITTLPKVAATYKGLMGPAKFNEYGERAAGYYQFKQVQGDQYVPVGPKTVHPPLEQANNNSSAPGQEEQLR